VSQIRCIYHGAPPDFPATDQHPDAVRYGPLRLASGAIVFVDAIGAPTAAEVSAVLAPPATTTETPSDRLQALGLSVADLKALLNLPT
jgi:hypothetical protein